MLRIDTAARKAEVFLGDLEKHDTFTNPRGLAVANGLLYVADPMANRIAVYNERTRKLVGEMNVTLPHVVQVHPESGAVYVCSYVPEKNLRNDGKSRIKEANLLKFNAYTDAKPAYSVALPRTGLSPNGGAHRIALDASADPPVCVGARRAVRPPGRRLPDLLSRHRYGIRASADRAAQS